ncbi:MAG: hypothetical protein AAFR03_04830 [Pseudomonadota bacterium]
MTILDRKLAEIADHRSAGFDELFPWCYAAWTAFILFEAIDKEALIKEAVAANLAVQDSLDSLRSFVESLSAEDLEPAPAMSEFSLL